jgi:hypothetical protein
MELLGLMVAASILWCESLLADPYHSEPGSVLRTESPDIAIDDENAIYAYCLEPAHTPPSSRFPPPSRFRPNDLAHTWTFPT